MSDDVARPSWRCRWCDCREFFGPETIIDSKGRYHRYVQCCRCGGIEVITRPEQSQQRTAPGSCGACERCTPHEPDDGWGDCSYEQVDMPVPLLAPHCRYGYRPRQSKQFRFAPSAEGAIERECGPLGR